MEHQSNKVLSFLKTLEEHPIYNNQYFNLLKQSCWNSDAYALHRANFFYRTEITVKCIAHICAKAAMMDDLGTLIFFSRILNEETGNGSVEFCHEVLMEKAHNLYGEVEFDLEPLLVNHAKHSDLILKETTVYRETIFQLAERSYQCLLGVAVALEHHADKMLLAFREAFRFNRKNLPLDRFIREVEVYFNCHVDNGVEERHAADARLCVINNCQTDKDIEEVLFGASKMLEVQQAAWDAMYQKNIETMQNNTEYFS